MKLLILVTLVMKWDFHLCYRSFLNTATQERTSLYFVISFLHINNMKGKVSMTSSQNWKNLEETRKHARKILRSNETIDLHKISKHSKFRSQVSVQATEIIKKCKFCENSHHHGKCLAYEKVSIIVIGKTILRSAGHVIEKLSTKLNKLKLNNLLLTNTIFSLI